MEVTITSEFLGACYDAKRITELMLKCPHGMKSSHIHVIDIIHQLQEENEMVRISDIGARMNVTNPGVTRVVNELVAFHAVEKKQADHDKRVFTVELTELGEKYYKKYICEYHEFLTEKFQGIDAEQMHQASRLIHEVYELMANGKRTSV